MWHDIKEIISEPRAVPRHLNFFLFFSLTGGCLEGPDAFRVLFKH